MGLEMPFWRAVAVFRVASLIYAALLIVRNHDDYLHPAGGWTVLVVMVAWTAAATFAYARVRVPAPSREGSLWRSPWRSRQTVTTVPVVVVLLAADLAIAAGCLLATRWVETVDRIDAGARTLPVIWVASAVLAWGVAGGKRLGAVAAGVMALAELAIHSGPAGLGMTASGFNSIVLLFFAGMIVGHVAELAAQAQERTAEALELKAAQRERERLARSIHDSVLQVLALVQRRGAELGGEAAELGRLAGEQEAALRALISGGAGGSSPDRAESLPRPGRGHGRERGNGHGGHGERGERTEPGELGELGELDLCELLAHHHSASVTIAAPATPVRLPAGTAREMAAAVGAALDNVRRHCGDGAKAWILVEDEGDAVTVSVRDEGPGIPDGRLEQAAADGRLGVAQSIKGRVIDLGGSVVITSAPGQGTEIEMRVPLV